MIKGRTLKDGTKVYDAYIYLGVNPDTGLKETTTSRGHATKREASYTEARMKLEWKSNMGKKKMQRRYKFKEVYDMWIKEHAHEVAPSTLYSYNTQYKRRVSPVFDKYYIEAIDIVMCRQSVKKWEKEIKSTNIPRAIVKLTLDYAIDLQLITSNPMVGIKLKQNKQPPSTNFYVYDELKDFLLLAKVKLPTKDYIAFRMMAMTGLRVGELCALSWDDVDLDKGTITINKTVTRGLDGNELIGDMPKTTASNRTLGLDNTTLNELKQLKIEHRKYSFQMGYNHDRYHNRVIPSLKFREFTGTNTIRVTLSKFIKQYELKKVTPHGFRHTHCSLLIEWGYSIKKIQLQMGHDNIETTLQIYSHVANRINTGVATLLNKKVDF